MSNRIVITGGAGLLAQFVAKELEGKAEITLLDLHSKQSPAGPVHLADIRDIEQLHPYFIDRDAIIHLAGLDSVSNAPAQSYMDVNVHGTYCVLEAAHRANTRQIVCCSTAAVYGLPNLEGLASPLSLPITEAYPTLSVTPYGQSKILAEAVSTNLARRYQLSIHSLRLSAVLFPHTIERMVERLGESEHSWRDVHEANLPPLPKSSDENTPSMRSYIDARDAAKAFAKALESDSPGHHCLNICADDTLVPHSSKELADHLFHPNGYARDQSYFDSTPCRSLISNEKARTELNWAPVFRWADHSKAFHSGQSLF